MRRYAQCQRLEDRLPLAGLPFVFTFDDPNNEFAPYPQLQSTLQAAGQVLSTMIEGKGSMEVIVHADNTVPRASAGIKHVSLVRMESGVKVVEHSTITEGRTGVDPNGDENDIDIFINTEDYLPTTWLDPSDAARTGTVPSDKLDFLTTVLHEVVHALGIQGYRERTGPNYGQLPATHYSTFDELTSFGAGGDPSVLYFVGSRAVQVYGSPVPLTSVGPNDFISNSNFTHLGNPVPKPGSDLIPDLMNGVQTDFGRRYSPSQLDLAILDDLGWSVNPRLTVNVQAPSIVETAGNAATTVTISRHVDIANPLTVNLTSSNTMEATVPATATIPAGQGSITVNLNAVDDSRVDGIQTVTITASAIGYENGSDTVNVLDNEIAALTVNIVAASVAENAGTETTATISRNTEATTSALVVNLSSNDTTEITVAATATIPAGQASVTVNLNVLEDVLVDGTQIVTVTATANGFASGSDTIGVTDNDSPALTVNVTAPSVTENAGLAATTATITRNTDTTNALVVDLISSDATEATVPSTTTIPVGQTSVIVSLDVLDDAVADGLQTVEITASANGFTSGRDTFDVIDNESPALTVNVVATSVAENAGAAATAITITRNADTSSALVVNLMSSDTTEAVLLAATTIPAGQTSVTVTLDAVDDAVADGTQSVTITASSSGIPSSSDTVDITDNEIPSLTVDIAAAAITENAGAAATSVTITRNTDRTKPLIIQLFSSDATEAAVPNVATIPAGQAAVTVNLDAIDDSILDGEQIVAINATAEGFLGISDTVRVNDDEQAGFTIVETDGNNVVSEDQSVDTISVRLTAQPSTEVVIEVASSDETEVTVDKAILIFNSANWNLLQTVTLSGVNDEVTDGDQTANITLRVNAAQSDTRFAAVNVQTANVTIKENDEAAFLLAQSEGTTEVSEAGTTDTFTVALAKQPLSDVVLTLTSASAAEATIDKLTLMFTPTTWSTPQTVTVRGVDDLIVDSDQMTTITVGINSAQSDDKYDALPPKQITVTAKDNERAGFVIIESEQMTVIAEAGQVDEFFVALSAQPLTNVVIQVSSSNQAEANADKSILTFTPTTWNQNQVVTVRAMDDLKVDGNHFTQFTVNVVINQSDDKFDGVVSQIVEVAIQDNDQPGFKVVETDGNTALSEAGLTDTITVELTAQPVSPVVLNVASSNLSEVNVDHPTLTFTSGNWNVPQTLRLLAVNDSRVDGDQAIDVQLSGDSERSDSNFQPLSAWVVNVTVSDDDRAGVIITETAGDTLVSETGSTDSFAVMLSAQPASDVVLNVLSTDSGEATTDKETLVFTPTTWNIAQTVTVTGIPDNQNDGDQRIPIVVLVDASNSDVQFGQVSVQEVNVSVSNVVVKPWQNQANHFDVTGDGNIVPLDVLRIINELNEPQFTSFQQPVPATRPEAAPYFDVDGNGFVTPLDALGVINFLNEETNAEGESQANELAILIISSGANLLQPSTNDNFERQVVLVDAACALTQMSKDGVPHDEIQAPLVVRSFPLTERDDCSSFYFGSIRWMIDLRSSKEPWANVFP